MKAVLPKRRVLGPLAILLSPVLSIGLCVDWSGPPRRYDPEVIECIEAKQALSALEFHRTRSDCRQAFERVGLDTSGFPPP